MSRKSNQAHSPIREGPISKKFVFIFCMYHLKIHFVSLNTLRRSYLLQGIFIIFQGYIYYDICFSPRQHSCIYFPHEEALATKMSLHVALDSFFPFSTTRNVRIILLYPCRGCLCLLCSKTNDHLKEELRNTQKVNSHVP